MLVNADSILACAHFCCESIPENQAAEPGDERTELHSLFEIAFHFTSYISHHLVVDKCNYYRTLCDDALLLGF